MATATDSPWVTKANNKEGGGGFSQPPAGTHGAVCVGVIDLGTHEEAYPGETPKKKRKIYLCWELTDEQDDEGKNFIIGKEYTWSLAKKSALRAVIEGWTGKVFNADEEFNVVSIIGKSCMITMTEEKKGDYTNTKLGAIGNIPKGFTVQQAKTPSFVYHTSDSLSTESEPPIPDWVPRSYGVSIKEKIMTSPEWLNDRTPY